MSLGTTAFNILNQLIIFSVTIGLSRKCFELKLQKTALHAYLCTLGFICLFTEGLLIQHGHNPFNFLFTSSESKTNLSAALQVIGGFLGIVGTLQKYLGKETHFKSKHAKWGLAACIFCAVHFAFGLACLYWPYFRVNLSMQFTNFIHNSLALVTFLTAMITQFYGYDTGFAKRNLKNLNLQKFLVVVMFILTIFIPLQIFLKKSYAILF